jgi:hypothetical protein
VGATTTSRQLGLAWFLSMARPPMAALIDGNNNPNDATPCNDAPAPHGLAHAVNLPPVAELGLAATMGPYATEGQAGPLMQPVDPAVLRQTGLHPTPIRQPVSATVPVMGQRVVLIPSILGPVLEEAQANNGMGSPRTHGRSPLTADSSGSGHAPVPSMAPCNGVGCVHVAAPSAAHMELAARTLAGEEALPDQSSGGQSSPDHVVEHAQ